MPEMEPNNLSDKYSVCIKGNNVIVGHLPLSDNGRFAKTIFNFVQADIHGQCDVTIIGKAFNRGDGEGIQVPCVLQISGQNNLIDTLKKQIL